MSSDDPESILHPSTVRRYSPGRSRSAADADRIKAVRIEDEELTHIQEDSLLRAGTHPSVGRRDTLAPPVNRDAWMSDNPGRSASDYRTMLHGMDQVIEATEQRKRADEARLRDCLKSGTPAGASR